MFLLQLIAIMIGLMLLGYIGFAIGLRLTKQHGK